MSVTEDMLLAMSHKAAQDYVERLESENAKLRVERDEWHRVAESKQDIIDHMRDANAENAKLRELALALADCRNTTCDDCVRWDYPDGGCSLDGVMRELGIEVNGWANDQATE